jgi:hypothetical protein
MEMMAMTLLEMEIPWSWAWRLESDCSSKEEDWWMEVEC